MSCCDSIEGGYMGCVVVFAAFFIQVVAFGTSQSIGVYNVELLRHFDAGAAAVSLVGSINLGVLLGAGPLASLLMSHWSHRQVALVGAVLTNIGLICLPFTPNLPYMYVFYGVITGLGESLVYVPSHVLSGLYFTKHRSLATGVATSGSGLGSTLFPIIFYKLIEHYGWRGSLFIVAGLNLHLLILAGLLRPVSKELKLQLAASENETLMQKELQPLNGPVNHVGCRKPDSDGDVYLSDDGIVDEARNGDLNKKCKSIFVEDVELYAKDVDVHVHGNTNKIPDLITSVDEAEKKYSEKDLDDLAAGESSKRTLDEAHCEHVDDLSDTNKDISEQETLINNSNYVNCNKQIVANGTMTGNDNGETRTLSTSPSSSPTKWESFKKHFTRILTIDFLTYWISNIGWNAGGGILVIFLPEFMISVGLDKETSSFAFTMMGAGSCVGCVIGGLLGNIKYFNRIALYSVANLLAGIIAMCFRFPVFQNVEGQLILVLVYGFMFGIILGLLVVVTSDLLGIEALGDGFGYLMLANGIGIFSGPPLAGIMIDMTGSMGPAFVFSGCCSLFAGLVMVVIPLRRRLSRKETKKQALEILVD